MNYDLDKFGLSEEELFSPVDNSSLESEKITAPRYSYWHSVFRVFFKKKINIKHKKAGYENSYPALSFLKI